MRHIISILMQNEAGALARVVALFSSRTADPGDQGLK